MSIPPKIHIIKDPITKAELKKMAKEKFGDLVKGAVDVEQKIMALGGELHVDEAVILNEQCQSKSNDIWGVNLYPDKMGEDMIEFDSMVNLKPSLGNRTRSIEDPVIREQIKKIVNKLILE